MFYKLDYNEITKRDSKFIISLQSRMRRAACFRVTDVTHCIQKLRTGKKYKTGKEGSDLSLCAARTLITKLLPNSNEKV